MPVTLLDQRRRSTAKLSASMQSSFNVGIHLEAVVNRRRAAHEVSHRVPYNKLIIPTGLGDLLSERVASWCLTCGTALLGLDDLKTQILLMIIYSLSLKHAMTESTARGLLYLPARLTHGYSHPHTLLPQLGSRLTAHACVQRTAYTDLAAPLTLYRNKIVGVGQLRRIPNLANLA